MVVGWQASSPTGTSRSASSPRTTPETPVRQAYSGVDLATVTPDTVLEQAAELLCSKASHRLPVVDGGQPAIISIGDLAIERDDTSALAHFSAAESNR
jgi:CBS domain-containing protein